MKFAVVLLMAVAASATMVEEPTFGSNVLAELRSKMVAGAPLDELNNILDDIKKRIEDAQKADDDALQADGDYCDAQEGAAKGNKEVAEAAAASAEQDRVAAVSAIEVANAEIDRRTQMIKENEAAIKQFTEDRADEISRRETEKQVFANNTRDSTICIDAIDKIKALPSFQTLLANEDRDESDFVNPDKLAVGAGQEGVAVTGVRDLLETTAKTVSAAPIVNLMELAALSMATLNGDVSDMLQLLNDLRKEMVEYRTQITIDEGKNKAAHEALVAKLTKNINDEEALKLKNETVRSSAQDDKKVAEGKRDVAIDNRDVAQAEADSIQKYIDDLIKGCESRREEHGNRKAERDEELATIEDIREILNEKLSKHFGTHDTEDSAAGDDHVAARMADVTVEEPQEEAPEEV